MKNKELMVKTHRGCLQNIILPFGVNDEMKLFRSLTKLTKMHF